MDVAGLELPPVNPGAGERALDVLRAGRGRSSAAAATRLRARLAAEGIETRTFFVPASPPARLHAASTPAGATPLRSGSGATGLYLPSGPSMSEDDVAYVADAIRRAGDSPSSAYSSPSSLAAAAGENRPS